MVLQYLLEVDQLPENSKEILNVDKLVLIFQFQFLFLCFHLQEIKIQLEEIITTMEKVEYTFSLNKKQLYQDGKKMEKLSKNSAQLCQLINK